jgi:hypothetical protein
MGKRREPEDGVWEARLPGEMPLPAIPFEQPPKGWTKATRLSAVVLLARVSGTLLRAFAREHGPHLPPAVREPLEQAGASLLAVVKASKPPRARKPRKAS